jgi:hypothetical protein
MHVETLAIDRCAAYAAARGTLAAIRHVTATWPRDLADEAKRAAQAVVASIAEALGYPHATQARRRCIREAVVVATELSAVCDVARALGIVDDGLVEAQRMTGRMLAMLGMLFHAELQPD